MMRSNSSVKGRGVMRWSKTWAMTAAFALALAAGLPSVAAGASATVETVTYSPQRFDFTVSPGGVLTGNNNITFRISRTDGAEHSPGTECSTTALHTISKARSILP